VKLGILGGTFDPIHLGHLLIAEMVRQFLQLERILFVPAGDPPHKQNINKTSAHHRMAMVKLSIDSNPHFELCPVDLERPGPHYSVDTVQLIQLKYNISADDCFFIIGGDSLDTLPTWHNPHKLVTLCRLAVVHRPGYQPDVSALEMIIPGLTSRVSWVEGMVIGIAASDIRAKIGLKQSIRYLVTDETRIYIQQQQLY
jgi:nicotinate-nucleotide adenylyltransferase